MLRRLLWTLPLLCAPGCFTLDDDDHLLMKPERLGVLTDVAQAFVLPDACREQSDPSATDVTVHVEGVSLEPCWDAIEDGSLRGPCIWYATQGGAPVKEYEQTQGWGAGILGLDEGDHVIRICDRDGKTLLGRREVHMERGSLTVARIWPLASDELDAGNACFP
jgi:hypothetical protein